jgi:hypothetical protein
MALIGFVLFIVSAISVIYPLRFLMIPNRLVAICGVVLGLTILGSATPTLQTSKTGTSSEGRPAYTSSGGCKTDLNGELRCSHSSEMNLFGSTSHASSEMKCGQNRVTLAYECKADSSAN